MSGGRRVWGQGDELPDTRREGPVPEALGGVLGEVARRKGWGRRLEGARVHEHWLEIAGEQLARHAEPVRLHGGVLLVRAESAAWATQVRYLSGELAARANEVLGAGQVSSVKVVAGPLEAASG
jgi:predicted nucleic acid-binding Zn ribbon protein